MTAKDLLPTRLGWRTLGVVAILFVAFWFRGAPLTPDPVRAANGPEQFDTAQALARLTRIIGDGRPHPVDSAALDAVRERLLTEVKALGYAPEVHTHDACRQQGYVTRCAQVSNVVFRAGPKDGKALVLTAHYDSVDDSPGAGDDGIGVAVWLEVASHFARTPPSRPVMFLITDGEETALLGAQAFSDNAAEYHVDVDRIINLEARGNRGPAMMFETSHPNDAVVSDWARGARRPVSNSLMTAVYELLPNSTDLTVHLRDHHAGINLAVADGFAFYHTEKDDLAHLDPRSVQHMGDQALAAARAYVASTSAPRGDIAYADVMTGFLTSLPGMPALVLLGLCLGRAAMLMAKPTPDARLNVFDWRAFALPPVVLVAGAAAAWLLQAGIGLVRPPAFWTAYPQAFNAAIFLASALMVLAGLAFLAQRSTRAMLFAAGWFWFLAVGVGLAFVVPGVVMLFLVPGVVAVVAALVVRVVAVVAPHVQGVVQVVAQVVAAAAALAVLLPLIQLFDVMMGLAVAPAFGLLSALALLPALGLIEPVKDRAAGVLAAGRGAAGCGGGCNAGRPGLHGGHTGGGGHLRTLRH